MQKLAVHIVYSNTAIRVTLDTFPNLQLKIFIYLFFFPSCVQAWERLEKAEHERELALRNELIRQEKLEQLARRFDRKAAMRETWLSENQRLVSQV